MPKTFYVDSPRVHYEVEDILLDFKVKKANIILPRGLAKSTIAAEVYPLYHLFMEDLGQPKLIIILSKTQGHAIDRLTAIKNVLEYNNNFKALFGYWGQHTAKVWRENKVKLKDGSTIVCRGTGQQIRGIKEDYVRPTLIIGDDLEDENNTKTAEAMEANLNWLLQGADYSLDAKKGRIVVIGTPLHQNCIVETLRDKHSDWHSIKYSYIYKENGRDVSLWEVMKSVKDLMREKKVKEEAGKLRIWYMERQCEVIGADEQLFREEDFKYYEGYHELNKFNESFLNITNLNGVELERPLKLPVNTFMGVDPASSTKQTADYSTTVVIAYDYKGRIFILPYFRKRVTPNDHANQILEYFKTYRPMRTQVETVGYQEMLRDTLRRKAAEKNLYIPGLETKYNPRTEKNARLETMQPFFANKRVYMNKGMTDLTDELLLYPRGRHDDLLDGLYYSTRKLYKPEHIAERQKSKLTEPERQTSWMAA